MVVESSGSTGWWAAAAAGRLWRAPLAAAIGTAVVVSVVKVMQRSQPDALTTPVAAGVAAGLLVAFVLFRVLRPSAPRAGGDAGEFATLDVPVLAKVPEMVTSRERHIQAVERRRVRILSGVMIAVSALGAAAAIVGLLQL